MDKRQTMIELTLEEKMAMENETDFCNVIAIIRCDAFEQVEQCLRELGVPGITVTCVKGYGEYTDFYCREWTTTHTRVEIFTATGQADAIAQAIMGVAHSGVPGDGIVAVQPVSKIYRIRNRAELTPDEFIQSSQKTEGDK